MGIVKKRAENDNKMKKTETGITLIALVITIIVLLILAGVSIATLGGQNGILRNATEASLKNDNSTVLDSLKLKLQEYQIGANIGQIEEIGQMKFLEESNIIDGNGVVNILNLLGQKLKTGNGSNQKDVYTVEDNHLYYYDKDGNKTDLGELGYETEVQEPTDPSLFEVSEDGTISLKDNYDYYLGKKQWTIENVVIPSEVDGKKVTGISYQMFATTDWNYDSFDSIKTIVIPEGVKTIEFYAFSNCKSLESIKLPESLEKIEYYAFQYCTSIKEIVLPPNIKSMGSLLFKGWTESQKIVIPFKRNELPSGWNSWWRIECDAKIIYEDDSEYLTFAQKYLENKTKDELEELVLKAERYIGTFDEFLEEIDMTREEFENQIVDKGMSYMDWLKDLLTEGDSNGFSWVLVEYKVSEQGGEGKEVGELEMIFAQKNGAQSFDELLSKEGMTRKQFIEEINNMGYRTEEDYLKVALYYPELLERQN